MSGYLQTIYSKEEYGQNQYPQKLCNHIYNRYLKEYLPKNGKKARLLDIGSGKGNHLVGFSRLGLEVYGIDKRDECLQILKDFDIRKCDLEKDRFPFEDNFFDFIFSKSVLEHVANTDNFLSESLRVLKPGGLCVYLAEDWQSEWKNFGDDYTHVKAFTRKGLQDALRINGFLKVECGYFWQLPFIWKYPFLRFIAKIVSLLPDSLKWKDKEETKPRKLIRFSKERMLLARGTK